MKFKTSGGGGEAVAECIIGESFNLTTRPRFTTLDPCRHYISILLGKFPSIIMVMTFFQTNAKEVKAMEVDLWIGKRPVSQLPLNHRQLSAFGICTGVKLCLALTNFLFPVLTSHCFRRIQPLAALNGSFQVELSHCTFERTLRHLFNFVQVQKPYPFHLSGVRTLDRVIDQKS